MAAAIVRSFAVIVALCALGVSSTEPEKASEVEPPKPPAFGEMLKTRFSSLSKSIQSQVQTNEKSKMIARLEAILANKAHAAEARAAENAGKAKSFRTEVTNADDVQIVEDARYMSNGEIRALLKRYEEPAAPAAPMLAAAPAAPMLAAEKTRERVSLKAASSSATKIASKAASGVSFLKARAKSLVEAQKSGKLQADLSAKAKRAEEVLSQAATVAATNAQVVAKETATNFAASQVAAAKAMVDNKPKVDEYMKQLHNNTDVWGNWATHGLDKWQAKLDARRQQRALEEEQALKQE